MKVWWLKADNWSRLDLVLSELTLVVGAIGVVTNIYRNEAAFAILSWWLMYTGGKNVRWALTHEPGELRHLEEKKRRER